MQTQEVEALKGKDVVLAFDIERSGARAEHDTIGIGASVVLPDFREVDHLFLPGFLPLETTWEKRCYDEFWSKNLDVLNKIKYQGTLTKRQRQREMVVTFQQFRAKWEIKCHAHGAKLHLVSDNNVYDGGFINVLIEEHTKQLPIPYSASEPQRYGAFFETHSEQRGLLAVVDPSFTKNWGFTKRIEELYDVPPFPHDYSHDHDPRHDAYTIACEQQVLFGIRDGRIKRKQ